MFPKNSDNQGRVKKISGELKNGPTRTRNIYQQTEASIEPKDGIRGQDDGGHMIAARFFGPSEQINYFPQNKIHNRPSSKADEGLWYKMEEEFAAKLSESPPVKVEITITPVFSGSSKRPIEFRVNYKYNGILQPDTKRIPNP